MAPAARRTSHVLARITRWKHSDIGDASLYGYIRKLKEFLAFCKNNEPGVLYTKSVAKKLQEDLRLPDSKKMACYFNLAKLKLTGYAAFELFMGSKLKSDNTNYTKEYYGGYRSAFKKICVWQNVYPSVNFKNDFKTTNVVTNLENVKKADEYFELATAIVGKANNGKYIAKTKKRYKSKPVGELSISTVRRRISPYVVDA